MKSYEKLMLEYEFMLAKCNQLGHEIDNKSLEERQIGNYEEYARLLQLFIEYSGKLAKSADNTRKASEIAMMCKDTSSLEKRIQSMKRLYTKYNKIFKGE